MIDLSKYRIIDLSYELVPGERKINGQYLHGEPRSGRPIEVTEFIAFEAKMHWVKGESHTGTHTEAPYKYSETEADLGSMPLDLYIGEAITCNFTGKKPDEPITPDDLSKAGVRKGDIVLAWGPTPTTREYPYLIDEAADWLIEQKIKALGIENLHYSPPGTPFGRGCVDARLLLAGVGIVDALYNLNQIRKPRVFFIALPVKIRRLTAFWTRAIALEEI